MASPIQRLNWIGFLVFLQAIFQLCYADSTKHSSIPSNSGKERAQFGVALIKPLLIAESKKDMWITAALEERFYSATALCRTFFVPEPQQLGQFYKNCPPRESQECKEKIMQRLFLQKLFEIRIRRVDSLLQSRITIHQLNARPISENIYYQTDGKKPFEFIAGTLEKAFEKIGLLSPPIKKRLNEFPSRQTDSYGCYAVGYGHFVHGQFNKAYYPLQRALELRPEFLSAQFLMARTQLSLNQLDKAARIIHKTEGLSTTWEMDLAIAEILERRGKTGAAFKKLKQAEKKLPYPVAICEFALGEYYLKISAPTRGISHLINAINLNPSILRYYFVLGLLYCQNKDYASAIPRFQKLIRLDPETKMYKLHLGIAYRHNQEPGRAIEIFESLLNKHPEYHAARINLALTFLNIGWVKKAAKLLEANVKIYRDTLNSYMNLALIQISQGQIVRGTSWLKKILKKYPNDFNTLVNLGLTEIKLKELAHAETHLKKAEQIKPSDAVLLMGLSTLYNRLNSEEKEFQYLNKVLEINPENIPALTRLAEHSIEEKDIPEAINYLLEIVNIDPDAYIQRLLLAECLMKEADTENAIEHYKIIENTYSHLPHIQLQLIRSLIRSKLFAKSVIIAENQLKHGKRIGEFHQTLGIAFSSQLIYGFSRRLNAESLALKHLSQALNIDKNNWETYFWLGRYYKSVKRDNFTAAQHFKKAHSLASSKAKKTIQPFLDSESY